MRTILGVEFPEDPIDINVGELSSSTTKKMVVLTNDSSIANPCGEALEQHFSLTKVGSITIGSIVVSEIFSGVDNLVLIRSVTRVPEGRCMEYMRRVLTLLSPSCVIVLDSVTAYSYVGTPGAAESLQFVTSSNVELSVAENIKGSRRLPVGNVLTGATAATLNYCEPRVLSCYALLVLREASYTPQAASVLAQGALPFISTVMSRQGGDQAVRAIPQPDQRSLVERAKRDAFMMATANIYT